jgi:hypothetical protein
MNIPVLLLAALLTESRLRFGLSLGLSGSVVALVLVAWCFKLSRAPGSRPFLLLTGVVPLFLLALLWPLLRGPIFATLVALGFFSSVSHRIRRALHVLLLLFTGFLPLFLLIRVDDTSWAAGFLFVYLGILSLEPTLADSQDAVGETERTMTGSARMGFFVYGVCVGFLWILVFAALLWYVPEPVTGA